MSRTLGRQMDFFGHRHSWRVLVVASGMLWFGAATNLAAATPDSTAAAELASGSNEPFGLKASKLFAGGIGDKWRAVERRLDYEPVHLARWHSDGEHSGRATAATC